MAALIGKRSRIKIHKCTQRCMFRSKQLRICLKDSLRFPVSAVNQPHIGQPLRELYRSHTALRSARYIPWSTQSEIFFGNFKTIERFTQDFQLFPAGLTCSGS